MHITIYQYDTPTGLRNPFIGQATGTVGNDFVLDGKTVQSISPDDASHVFAIPEMGVSVPLKGADPNAKNPCANAPCSLSDPHRTISFTIRTPGKGVYRWQCYRAVRGRLHPGQRRPDADGRVHGRLHQGRMRRPPQ